MVSVSVVADGIETMSTTSVKIVANEKKTNSMVSVSMVADGIETKSTTSVKIVANEKKTNSTACVNTGTSETRLILWRLYQHGDWSENNYMMSFSM